MPTDCFVEISAWVLIPFVSLICTFCVNLGGFYERVVLIFLVLIFSLDFLIIGKSVHPYSKLGRSRLSLLTSKVFMAVDLYSSKVIIVLYIYIYIYISYTSRVPSAGVAIEPLW